MLYIGWSVTRPSIEHFIVTGGDEAGGEDLVCDTCTTSSCYRVFSQDVTAAILVSQTNTLGVVLFSYANDFFCSNKFG